MNRRTHSLLALVAMLLVGALVGAPFVRQALATITFTIPNTFGSQSGSIPVSQIDSNFSAIQTALSGLVAATTDLPLTRAYTGTQRWAKGADIASAATLNLGSDGNYFVVTGVTTITAISTYEAGTIICLRFASALTLTHNATSLILTGATNATTATGDLFWFISDGGGNWRELWRRPVTGAISTTFFNGFGQWATPAGSIAASAKATVALGVVTVLGGTNITSITYNGVGDYTVNFTTNFSNTNYKVAFGNLVGANRIMVTVAQAVGTFHYQILDTAGAVQDSNHSLVFWE